jgi:hypothetical protein
MVRGFVRLGQTTAEPMTVMAPTKANPLCDTDYLAARRACSSGVPGEEDNLCAKLDGALKLGWSIQALKAYAFSVWRSPDCDHVTNTAWRLSVEFAESNGCSGGREFLKRFNADLKRYSCEAPDGQRRS